ncbi:hypothetical protein Ae201684P_019993 [Aphanomyces euteiches]|uniref:Ankyrin repeat-containing domain n=1 Tax=Aphanomyces euteiches TaxID=100861 RepID=A0A6G0XDW9_9STRA|nr:hypothetical protein Ae201684_005788 [Aphanomyces euteiches]KAH9078930.1 hypothetical protein Ae201684P_019993 [Aphanomyces euteiches]KAH9140846.1 hypothetical protein AeRB84_014924 [Aphanomyces euteiches]
MAKRQRSQSEVSSSRVLRSLELRPLIFQYQDGIYYEFLSLHQSMKPFRLARRGCLHPMRVEELPDDHIEIIHNLLSTCYASQKSLIKMLHSMEYMRSFVAHHVVFTGNVAIAEQLDEAFGIAQFPGPLIDIAARRGHFAMVQFLHEHGHPGCSTDAMDSTALTGDMEILLYLHTHRSEGCSTDAMDDAAACGNLEIVQFLHNHRYEGCTVEAMDRAATGGHLRVVEFLHFHRTEGCTTNALDGAAANGRMDVVRFLSEHRQEGCTRRALKAAARRGDLAMVKYLHGRSVQGLTYAELQETCSMTRDASVLDYLAQISVLPCSDDDMMSDY